jgi:hypothetical protein
MNTEIGIPRERILSFREDTAIVGRNTTRFLEEVYPYTSLESLTEDMTEPDSETLLKRIRFLRIETCTIEDTRDVFEYLNMNIQKYLTAAYALEVPLCYGIVGQNRATSLVIGFEPLAKNNENPEAMEKIVRGLLPDIKLSPYSYPSGSRNKFGIIGGTPSFKIDGEVQKLDFSALMRGLNGQDYTLLVLAKPVPNTDIQKKIDTLLRIKDECLAVSKRNISLQQNAAHSEGRNKSETETQGENVSFNIGGSRNVGVNLGGISLSKGSFWGVGLGSSHSNAKTIGTSVNNTISNGQSLGLELQNSFALDIVKRIDNTVERLQRGIGAGFWQTAVCYSSDNDLALKIMRGALYSEIAKPDALAFPPRIFTLSPAKEQTLLIPKGFLSGDENEEKMPLCSLANSEELSLLFSLPDKNVPGYELRTGKRYPVSCAGAGKENREGGIVLGAVCDASTKLENIPFPISHGDLNKHTFVCGITGSGKTHTVKHILRGLNKPFWVIECAKKEYRSLNLKKMPEVYTLGRPEVNGLLFNPFYIMRGISPQLHIDYLKDLFNASFSFYGPMPYILEKCLHNIYQKRGWNLSMGYHPHLANTKSSLNLFDSEYMRKRYDREEHRFLFPTMQDLKNEVEAYMQSMDYDGELKGNIKTAILARLESLCVGAKGYMFNTNEFMDLPTLTQKNVIFELEGLADDADKAFSVGLLIIFLTEYRFTEKEEAQSSRTELKHLLVIEEAHRLLKNISTEKTSEDLGNPKGKAIEHFTNIIAEMRGFGQGVLISEQIPAKIAPDVIKNTSNKIIHRIVAKDDQELIANMIGMDEKDALFLGDQITGRALCHIEGMRLPVSVAVPPQTSDIDRKDGDLRRKDLAEKEKQILKSMIYPYLADKKTGIESDVIRLINTIFAKDPESIMEAIKRLVENAEHVIKKTDAALWSIPGIDKPIRSIIAERIITALFYGTYKAKEVPKNTLQIIKYALEQPDLEPVAEMIKIFTELDSGDEIMLNAVTELAIEKMTANSGKIYDKRKLVSSYFLCVNEQTVEKILDKIEKRSGGII